MLFSDLGLSDDLLRAVHDAGYTEPTPIQAEAIPYVLMGRDVLGCAQTGTGKTASFTLPMIDILAQGRGKARMPRSLILEPTRELAAQVAENFDIYGKNHRLNKALLIGGENLSDQAKILNRGVDVLIATPGRLIDMFERGFLLLTDVKVFVIDESDRMLDMGFIPDVERIAAMLPPLRTTLLFSATMPKEIKKLAEKFLRNPKEVTVSPPATTADTITQGLLMLGRPRDRAPGAEQKMKREALRKLIDREQPRNALIFCNRKRDVDVVHRSLNRHGYEAARLHGDMSQPMRMETLAKFKTGDMKYLVCSDVAARGLDIPEMSHVFNFDVPTHAEDYVHRIGRTGRAGRKGNAFTIAVPADGKYIDMIERLTKMPIPRIDLDGKAAETAAPPAEPAEPAALPAYAPATADDETSASASEDKPRRRRRSRRRGGAEAEENSNAAETVSSAPSAGEDRRPAKRGPAALPDANDSPVKGLGDHVPAFMLRKVDADLG
ncbi:MAG: DEAD/DEAH box helicase [Rhodospirillaceae bacterium]